MKKFIIGIMLFVLFLLAPVALVCLGIMYRNLYMFIGAGISALLYIIIRRPLADLIADGRQAVDYDEFGRSRRKGDFRKLSRAEQDAIDYGTDSFAVRYHQKHKAREQESRKRPCGYDRTCSGQEQSKCPVHKYIHLSD